MSYCLNPDCPNPENESHAEFCHSCGTKLLLRDRYRVIKALGQGGFGATFVATDESLPGEPSCVIKQLRPAAAAPHILEMARELFHREAKTLGKIGNHPQVPRLLDYFENNQQFYLVQEYVSGLTLQQEVRRDGPLSESGVKQFLSEILPVLRDIHNQQVIHRDIKPANLIRREQDRKLVLIDFGAVKNQVNSNPEFGNSEQTTLTAYAIGTPGFAPPEQMAMRPVYASDIYALGVTCIYLLTARTPKELDINPKTGEVLWQRHIHISNHFAEVLKKMLEVSVGHRYQSAEEVLRALDLEPYLDSLAQGLATKPNTPSRPIGHNYYSGELQIPSNPSTPGSGISATSKLAMEIRARRARREQAGLPLSLGGIGGKSIDGKFPAATSLKTSGASNGKQKAPIKLDPVSLLTSYSKGRRDFAQQDLSNLNLEKANLSGGIFNQAKLIRTNLQGADLTNSDFARASLNRAILRDANLGRAFFHQADLEGADLRGADLSFANLSCTNLRGANLCGANLTGAKVNEEQLASAKTNWTTVLPNGKRGFW